MKKGSDIMQYMPNTDLPPASITTKNIKMGDFEVKAEGLNKTSLQVHDALSQLEKAVKDKVFVDNGQAEQ